LAKARAKKQTKGRHAGGKPAKRRLPWFAWLFIALAVAGLAVFVRIYATGQPPPDNVATPRAAIVDQLSSIQVNEAFIAEITRELEEYGFQVDLYQGDEIDVDFYRELPTHGYKLIVFRAHSGILAEHEEIHWQTLLFTNEIYSRARHWADQFDGRLAMATVGEDYPMVFGIPPQFITESMKGNFDDTVIIMMGCSGIHMRDLAQAFIEKGASAYLAWNATVDLYYVDEATAYLVRQLCSEELTIKEAVDSTMAVIGLDPQYQAGLEYYPLGIGDRTLEKRAL